MEKFPQMSFHAPVKELQPVDTSLPQHIIKGAVVLDPKLTEWTKKTLINSHPSAFILINRQEQTMEEVLKNASQGLQLPENETYGLISENPKKFITDANLDQLTHGFMLTMTASPDQYVRRINEILLQGNDLREMEWAVAKLDEFSLDLALIEAFYKFSSLDLLFSMIRDDRVCMSSTLLSTCLRALSGMLEVGVGSVGWHSVPKDVVASVASLVTGKAKREESNTLHFALQMIEQLVNNNETTRDWVLEEVPIESLIRHVEKSDERIALSALSLMNSMLNRCPDDAKRVEMIKSLEGVPFRNAVHSSLLRTGYPRSSKALEQLVVVQRHLISAYDKSTPSDSDVQKILAIETLEEELNEDLNDTLGGQLKENKLGKLVTGAVLRMMENSPQDLRMLISENTMRIDGGKWQLVPFCIRCAEIVAELFGILPGKDDLNRLIPILFSSENVFDNFFACVAHLFHRTWREMQAKDGEMDKVGNVVCEQIRHVLKKELLDTEHLTAALEAFSYGNMEDIWKEEQNEKENDQLHSQAVIDLGKKLLPKMEEIMRINCRNYMKKGTTFRKQAKGKNLSKVGYWFWKLDASEKMLTVTVCENENYVESCAGIKEDIRQIWLKDIADVTHNDELDRKGSSSRFGSAPSPLYIRGIRVQLKEGDVLTAVTNDDSLASIWVDGLSNLIGKTEMGSKMVSMVDRMLKMELRVRLLNIKTSEQDEKPVIPPIPENLCSIIGKY